MSYFLHKNIFLENEFEHVTKAAIGIPRWISIIKRVRIHL